MQLKFGAVPDELVAQVASGSIEQLDRWIERVLSAESARDVVARG